MTFDPQDINTTFSDYFRTLYTTGYSGSSEDLLNLLQEISLPNISEDARPFLNYPYQGRNLAAYTINTKR